MKRAGSSDLAVMQGSGYYQTDKTRWRTLYWTVREIIQRTLGPFRRRSTHVPNLTDEFRTAKERLQDQFGTAVLVWCGKSVKFDRVCRTLSNLTQVRHTVRRLNQMSRQCRSKVELIQLGSAHEKYGV